MACGRHLTKVGGLGKTTAETRPVTWRIWCLLLGGVLGCRVSLELTTSRLAGGCSFRLSYRHVVSETVGDVRQDTFPGRFVLLFLDCVLFKRPFCRQDLGKPSEERGNPFWRPITHLLHINVDCHVQMHAIAT